MTGTSEAVVAELERTVAALRGALNTAQEQRDAALAREVALADILGVINRSPGDPGPVFEAILEKAHRLCGAETGALATYDGAVLVAVATHGLPEPLVAALRIPFVPGVGIRRLIDGQRYTMIPDLRAIDWAPDEIGLRGLIEHTNARTRLTVPMRKDGVMVGIISANRGEVRPFSESEITLLERFAAQAVIAVENARLLGELQTRSTELGDRNIAYAERIEHQAATIDVLKEMSASPGDAQPVFDLICERARALTGSMVVALFEYDGELIHFRSNVGIQGAGGTAAYAAYSSGFPRVPDRGSPAGRAILDKVMCHIRDVPAEPGISQAVRELRYGTQVSIPLLRHGRVIGALSTGSTRVDDISDSQIELLKTFAEQAVIAITSAETYRALQRRTADLQESLEYQTATTDVLKMISRSTFDLQPVLRMVAETAARLCRADQAAICRRDGDMMYLAANFGFPAEYEIAYAELGQFRIDPHSTMAIHRAVVERRAVHIPDAAAVPGYAERVLKLGKVRTALSVPLLREGDPVGGIALARQRLEPFTERQIDLVRTFADQAVIAIENTRLLSEQREALERQTATAEVLQVINASPGDLAPVFDAILEKAHALCGATLSTLQLYQDDWVKVVAIRGAPEALELILRQGWPYPVNAAIPMDVMSHIDDSVEVLARNPDSAVLRAIVEIGQVRTQLHVPLRKDGVVIGRIAAARREVRPFTGNEISLLENFAAQAVIAMENARLLGELRERTADLSRSLEQQTAMADVLAAINANPGELAPVFDTILEKAHVLCGSAIGHLALYENGGFRRAAYRGLSADTSSMLFEASNTGGLRYRLSQGERFVHVPDLAHPAGPLSEAVIALRDKEGIRCYLLVPMRRDGALLGYISANWTEPRADITNELTLLENFAAQAVIAMENARLLTEQREALARQTATADVLRIINESPGDLTPVFDAILEKALNLSESTFGLVYKFDGKALIAAAMRNLPPAFEEWNRDPGRWAKPMDITQRSPAIIVDRLILGEDVVHVTDITDDDAYRAGAPQRVALADLGGARSALAVALRKDDVLLGEILLYRQEVRAYAADQIELVKGFAAQAVIAMENARLLTEQREALERQTAMAEVLGIINASPGNLTPVFEAILDKAMELCGVAFGELHTFDGTIFQATVFRGAPAEYVALRGAEPVDPRMAQGSGFRRFFDGENLVHYVDLKDDEAYRNGVRGRRLMVDLAGARTGLAVSLRSNDRLLGAMLFYRREVKAFDERQISLLQSFAAQAVIAIENARLITEQREALERQTAVADVLQVINRSPGDLVPVFNAMLERAFRLCDAEAGALWVMEGEIVTVGAFGGFSDTVSAFLSQPFIPGPETGIGRLMAGQDLVQIADLAKGPGYLAGDPMHRLAVDNDGLHGLTAVPLRKDGIFLGAFGMMRRQPGYFTDKQIALLRDFAAQAVIAMENARLLNEIRRRQGELDVTFQNMGDGVALFDETHHLAAWNRNFQDMIDVPTDVVSARPGFNDYIQYLADRGEYGPEPGDIVRRLRAHAGQHAAFERTRPNGRVIRIRTNPTPEGGFVVMYTDITESKRAEDALRAARDAAENALRELKIAQANLVQAEKMASLGQLTAGIAHEIKNPLNFVNNFAALSVDLLAELNEAAAPGFATLTEDQRADIDDLSAMLTTNLQKITEHGKRADGIVRAMLEHSRGSSGERRKVDLNALVDEALNLAYHGARAQDQSFNITLERDFATGIAPIELNPQDMTRVFLNMFTNGFYAANKRAKESAGPGFEPVLKVSTRAVDDTVEIRIRDNGTGISPDIRDKLFQPFFTTKPTGEGTGLGLSITYDIVTKSHGGTIAVDSEVGAFSEFTVTLPRRMFDRTESAS